MTPDLSVRKAADHLGVGPEAVRKMAREGAFPNAYKSLSGAVNSPIRIPWKDIEDFRRKQPRVNR